MVRAPYHKLSAIPLEKRHLCVIRNKVESCSDKHYNYCWYSNFSSSDAEKSQHQGVVITSSAFTLTSVNNVMILVVKKLWVSSLSSFHHFLCSLEEIHSKFASHLAKMIWQNMRCRMWYAHVIPNNENIWATTWQNQQRLRSAWVLSYPLSAQRRLWSDWA